MSNIIFFPFFQIPLDDYLPTWRGSIIDANVEMNPARVVGMSLSVNAEGGIPGTKTGPGDFQLEIDCIKAIRLQIFGRNQDSVSSIIYFQNKVAGFVVR